ncbi:hypothetical protein E2320_012876, partial [Naja naja]
PLLAPDEKTGSDTKEWLEAPGSGGMTNLTNAAGAEQMSETDLCFACRRLMTLNLMKLEVHFQQKQ